MMIDQLTYAQFLDANTAETPSVSPASGDVTIQAWVRPGQARRGVTLHSGPGFSGAEITLRAGRYDNLLAVMPNGAKPASIDVPPGMVVTFFSDVNCTCSIARGFRLRLTESADGLPKGSDDLLASPEWTHARSMLIVDNFAPSQDFAVLSLLTPGDNTEITFDGHKRSVSREYCLVIDVNGYNPLQFRQKGWPPKLNAVDLPPGMQVRIFNDFDFQGQQTVISGAGLVPAGASLGICSAMLERKPGAPANTAPPQPSVAQPSVENIITLAGSGEGIVLDCAPQAHSQAAPHLFFAGQRVARKAWQHLAFVRKGTSLAWYFNGRRIKSVEQSPVPTVTGGLKIGGGFSGFLGPVSVIHRALDDKALAASRFTVLQPPIDGLVYVACSSASSHGPVLTLWSNKSGASMVSAKFAETSFPVSPLETSSARMMTLQLEVDNHTKLGKAKGKAAADLKAAHDKAIADADAARPVNVAKSALQKLDLLARVEEDTIGTYFPSFTTNYPPGLFAPVQGRAIEVTALCVDLGRTKTYYAGTSFSEAGGSIIATTEIRAISTQFDSHLATVTGTVTALALDLQQNRLWWIDSISSKLTVLDLSVANSAPKAMSFAIPTAPGGQWSLAIETMSLQGPPAVQRRFIYWSEGRTIWQAQLDLASATVSSISRAVSHGNALRPIALAIDDTFVPTFGTNRPKVFWLDAGLGQVMALYNNGRVQALYPVTEPHAALAIDPYLKRLYWNAGGPQPTTPGASQSTAMLFSGATDGSMPAVALGPMQAAGSLIVASKAGVAHQRVMEAHAELARQQQLNQAKLAAANHAAGAALADAHAKAAARKLEAQQSLATAKTTLDAKRLAAHQQFADETTRQNKNLADAKLKAQQEVAQAKIQASNIQQNADIQKQKDIAVANAQLAAERAKL